jgi:hypothetical protein
MFASSLPDEPFPSRDPRGTPLSEHQPGPRAGSPGSSGTDHGAPEFLRSVTIDGVTIHLPAPITEIPPWIGREDLLKKLTAAWTRRHPGARPLHPVLIGEAQLGKTTLAIHAASLFHRGVYVFSCDESVDPQDLLITVVLDSNGAPRYMGSPLVAAMVNGGTIVIDDASRLRPRAFSSLIPVLDFRAWADSVVAGVRIHAAPGFRMAMTMNESAETFAIPRNIQKRLGPWIPVGFPESGDLLAILEAQVPDDRALTRAIAERLQYLGPDAGWSVTDAIRISEWVLNAEASGLYSGTREEVLDRAIQDWFAEDSPARDDIPGAW